MSQPDPDRAGDAAAWRQAYAVFGELLEMETAVRDRHLATLDLDPDVRAQVSSLLEAVVEDGPLDHLPGDRGAVDRPGAGTAPADPALDDPALADPAPVAGTKGAIAGWRLGEELGRGGMGIVYRAFRDGADFEQAAALKLIRTGVLGPGAMARFRREQQVLARLEHPNIARLIDGGVAADGNPFLVLQVVDGEPIDRAAASRSATVGQVVEWVQEICGAVDYAHRNLIVHRDLKPGNILIDQQGQVRLLDFGVAKLLDEDPEAAETTRVLTPGYGAPEQRRGGVVTTATDVYGIGAVLYRLLAGRPPEEAGSTPPSAVPGARAGMDGDLDNIIMMALREEPGRRYPSASALADDLACWQQQRPVSASPDGLGYRLRKLVARHRWAVVAGTVAALSLLGGSGVALWQGDVAQRQAHRAQASAEDARLQLARARAVTDFLVDTFRSASPAANEIEKVSAREILDAGLASVASAEGLAPDTRRNLRSVLGEIAFWLGDLDRTESLLAVNLESAQSPPAGDAEAVDRYVRDLRFAARSAFKRGEQSVAFERFEAALARVSEASLGEQLNVALFHASTLLGSGQADQAAARMETLIADGTATAGTVLQEAAVHGVLASAYEGLRRLEEGKQQAEKALAFFAPDAEALDSSGAERPAIERALYMSILARIEADLGNLDRALTLSREALATRLPVFGAQHPDILVARNDLATLLKNLGQFAESAAMLEAVLADQLATLGPEHPYLAYTRFNLGEAWARAADRAENPAATREKAIRAYRLAVDRAAVQPEAFGNAAVMFRGAYGHALARAGRVAEGEAEIRRALASVDDNDRTKPRLSVLLGALLNDRGHHAKAGELLGPVVASLATIYGEGSRAHALGRLEQGRALAGSDPDAARRALEDGLGALRSGPFKHQYAREIAIGEAALATVAPSADRN